LHRDRGVIGRSIGTLVELGDERGEQLALAHAGRRRTAHGLLQALGEVLTEQLAPVRHGEYRPWHLAHQPANDRHLDPLPEGARLAQLLESHASFPFSSDSPLRRRLSPAPSAAATVTSKIRSSSWPSLRSFAMSSSVIL